MSTLKVGALFAGYGGIELALASVLDTEPAWFSEFDKAPSAILAHHWPDVPNYGDVTKIDWAAVEPVDIITGGSPCQDLSHAGKRAGMKAGTRSGLWASMCDAIDIIRPRLVVWENVRGALSAEADSAVEPCPFCVGDEPGVTLRALGRVLGDLAELGYDAWWYGLRAADVGAAHGRWRVFVFATPADSLGGGWDGWASHAVGRPIERTAAPGSGEVPDSLRLLPTPTTVEGTGPGSHGTGGDNLRTVVDQLLPPPTAADSKASGGSSPSDVTLTDAVVRTDLGRTENPRHTLLLTPRATDGTKGGPNQRGSSGDLMLPSAVQALLPTPTTMQRGNDANLDTREGARANLHNTVAEHAQDWREYEAAIRRQEHAFGRPAPLPTEPGAKGQPRLSPAFVEWLMGLPAGHVTNVPGVSRNDQLKALGNGVVPQQCAAALRAFLADTRTEVAS